jgi:hypothetical protein
MVMPPRIGSEYVDVIGTARERNGTERLLACCVHEFMRVLYSRGVLDQVQKDLPRMACTVNGRRVKTLAEFRQHVSLVNESYVHAMVPFASQTSMAVPVELLHETFGGTHDASASDPPYCISDARGPLSVEFVVKPEVWSVRIRKKMRVERRTAETKTETHTTTLAVTVIYESLAASVLVYWEPALPV